MTATNREFSIKKTLGYEGGYCNDPGDPGGPTKYGITIIDVRLYVKHDATAADVKALTVAQAIDIYRAKYWAKVDGDNKPDGVDFATFDYGVNSGVGRGNKVFAKVSTADAVATVKAICGERLSFLHGLRTWRLFGKGWGPRVADVEATGVKMALTAAGHAPEVVKQKLEEHGAAASTKATTQGAIVVSGGATTQLPQAPDPSTFDLTTKVGVGLAVAAALLFVCWHVWQNIQRSRAYAQAAKETTNAAVPA